MIDSVSFAGSSAKAHVARALDKLRQAERIDGVSKNMLRQPGFAPWRG